jgi:hypothetical protein
MKEKIILLCGPVMLLLTASVLQTIEYNLNNDIPVTWIHVGVLVCAAIWCIAASRCNRMKAIKELERLFGKMD